ncbi:hypothetical protein C8R42DRAFT_14862 [Lentinula raphanica]|nr:hypothetical protein C8R42DRAFT_14862 [Lentinula raphanica]
MYNRLSEREGMLRGPNLLPQRLSVIESLIRKHGPCLVHCPSSPPSPCPHPTSSRAETVAAENVEYHVEYRDDDLRTKTNGERRSRMRTKGRRWSGKKKDGWGEKTHRSYRRNDRYKHISYRRDDRVDPSSDGAEDGALEYEANEERRRYRDMWWFIQTRLCRLRLGWVRSLTFVRLR